MILLAFEGFRDQFIKDLNSGKTAIERTQEPSKQIQNRALAPQQQQDITLAGVDKIINRLETGGGAAKREPKRNPMQKAEFKLGLGGNIYNEGLGPVDTYSGVYHGMPYRDTEGALQGYEAEAGHSPFAPYNSN